jgi:hypothetical protein
MVESVESLIVSDIDPHQKMRDDLTRTWRVVQRRATRAVARVWLSAVLIQGPVPLENGLQQQAVVQQCDSVCEALKLSERIIDMRTVNTDHFRGVVFDGDRCGVGLARINRIWETYNKCPKGSSGHPPLRPWNQ